jgi:acetylornithine deacetylase/succinyl-diaminopimelate desuccinylase-like protein
VRLARKLFELWRSLVLSQQPQVHPAFEPGRATVNWGVARASGPRCELIFEARLLPGHDPEALTATFVHDAVRLGAAAHAEVRVEVPRASPALLLDRSSELLATARAACREVGLPDLPRCKPTVTEAGLFARAGVEAFVFGPGRSEGNAHFPNEFNLLSQMEKAIEFYRALITRLCV